MKLQRVLTLNMFGDDVKYLQTKLKENGFLKGNIDSNFGQNTLVAVINLQKILNVKADGVVGSMTWNKLENYNKEVTATDIPNHVSHIGSNGLKIYDHLLDEEEYVKEETKKDTIWLHGSLGGSRPDWTIGGWTKDILKDKKGNPILDQNGQIQPLKVANSYVIGRKSSSTDEEIWDGKILKSFEDKYWAYHLDVPSSESYDLNSRSVGIEFCNYGPLTIGRDGRFYNIVSKPISEKDVIKLDNKFRGYEYFEKYTDAQIDSARKLIIYLINKWAIQIDGKIYNESWFGVNTYEKGIKSASQIKSSDVSIFPQKEMIQMLNSI